MPYSTPFLTVVCTAYNQEQYIALTLNGFVSQQCTYPIEVIVHDDASTDGTADIIRSYAERYPALIKPIIQTENQYSKGVDILQEIIQNHTTAKYIALCEGDDYWTDPLKLQKQFDYMEANPDCGLTYTRARCFDQVKGQLINIIGWPYISFEQTLIENPIVTLTSVFEREICLKYYDQLDSIGSKWKMGDYPLWLYIAAQKKVHFMNYVSGVYRILPNSASHSTDTARQFAFLDSANQVKLFFAERYAPQMVQKVNLMRTIGFLHFAINNKDSQLLKTTKAQLSLVERQLFSAKEKTIYALSHFPPLCRLILRLNRLVH